MDRAGFDKKRDPPEFTNEVQHLKQVVPCRDTVSCRSRNAARLPVFMKTGNRSGKSLQLWIASRSEEHTSELQSLMRISYAVFCLKKKNTKKVTTQTTIHPITHSVY